MNTFPRFAAVLLEQMRQDALSAAAAHLAIRNKKHCVANALDSVSRQITQSIESTRHMLQGFNSVEPQYRELMVESCEAEVLSYSVAIRSLVAYAEEYVAEGNPDIGVSHKGAHEKLEEFRMCVASIPRHNIPSPR